jgi:tripartite-type tricarboxylate transporter receptor subunit TctC
VKDFTAIGLGATFQFALAAGPASGAKTWAEFVSWAKANPSKASYATSAAGSLPHFVGVLLSRDIGIDMVHVPYKGSGAYMNDLMGGQVPSAIDTIADLSEQHRAGRIRILATTGATRAPATPDVPTFSELGLKERSRLRLVRILRATEHAEGGDRHARTGHQQGADIT